MKKIMKRLIVLGVTLAMILQTIPIYAANECSHINCSETHIRTQYRWNESTYHLKTDVYEGTCNDCSETITIVKSSSEPHNVVSGKCVCGYKECSHSNYKETHISTEYGWNERTYHLKTDVCERSCNDCGESITIMNVLSEPHNVISGQCVCGYQECSHGDYSHTYIESKYRCNEETSHTRSDIYEGVCKDCGESETLINTSIEAHQLISGVCVCGYSEPVGCEHKNVKEKSNGEYKYTEYDEEYHRTKESLDHICKDCGELLKTTWDKYLEDHTFNSRGVCYYCGYEETEECSHSDTEKYPYKSPKWFTYSDTKHAIRYYYEIVCEDCGETVDKTSEFEYYSHKFGADGKCACGYMGSSAESTLKCQHRNYKDYYAKKSEPVKYNDAEHYMKHHMDRVCEDCGETIDKVFSYEWAPHKLDSKGKCQSNCGYQEKVECSHSNFEYCYNSSRYISYDESEHYVKQVYDVVCNDCNEVLNQNYDYEYGKHKFNSKGKCACGYSKEPTKPSPSILGDTAKDEKTSSIEILNYSIELDNSQDYVTIRAEGSSETAQLTICLSGPDGAIDAVKVQSKTAKVKFRIPFTEEVVEYKVLIAAYADDLAENTVIKETFTANNPKTLWNWIAEGGINAGAATFGFATGFVKAGLIDTTFFIADALDYGLNIFDKEQYEKNSQWRDNIQKNIDEFLETRVSDERANYYYVGSFTGEITEFAVGVVCIVNGVKGIVKNVVTHSGGVKVATVVLENGDEALAIVSKNSDEFIAITSRMDDVVEGINDITKIPNKGFENFSKLKKYLGNADEGYAWHHIVEQCQIDKSGFAAEQINNLRNVVQIPSGYSGSIHSEISKIYSSKQIYSEGLTVRNWLAKKSFEEQFEFGLQMLREYGTLIATETGWIFTPFN